MIIFLFSQPRERLGWMLWRLCSRVQFALTLILITVLLSEILRQNHLLSSFSKAEAVYALVGNVDRGEPVLQFEDVGALNAALRVVLGTHTHTQVTSPFIIRRPADSIAPLMGPDAWAICQRGEPLKQSFVKV